MGMYTELVVGCRLVKLPNDVWHQLDRLVGEREVIEVVDNNGAAWPFAIGGSADFPCQHATLEIDEYWDSFVLNIRMSRKNYHGEMESFLRWLRPYVAAGSGSHDLFAWTHYEEDRLPTFYFLDEAKS